MSLCQEIRENMLNGLKSSGIPMIPLITMNLSLMMDLLMKARILFVP